MWQLGWFFLVLLLSACTKHVTPSTHETMQTETRLMKPFQKIKVQGPFDIELHTGYKRPRLKITAARSAMPFIETRISVDGTLLVLCPQHCAEHGQVYVRIDAGVLRDFQYQGGGIIVGKKVHASRLNLSITNKGATHLGGYLGLNRVTIKGGGYTILEGVHTRALYLTLKAKAKVQLAGYIRPEILTLSDGSWLSMYWVEANRLTLVERGSTVIQMAGVVNILDLELWDEARFKGRYLCAKETFVKANDHTLAEITSVKHQHTLASGGSDIYFYNVPPTKADFMAYNGAVLDMQYFNRHERYDPYHNHNW